MSHTVRLANSDDIEPLASWTADTFSWGDYVPERLPLWLDDEDSAVLVAVVEGEPVALVHVVMLSETEGFLEAARVHPEHRRRGMGNDLNNAGVEWVRSRGGRVVRLVTESTNSPAIDQVAALGFRETSTWASCSWERDAVAIDPTVPALQPAARADVDAAWLAWSASDLYQAGRGLLALGWQVRNATPHDLVAAAAHSAFHQSPAGWLITDLVGDNLRVGWFTTSQSHAPALLAGLRQLANELDVERVSLKSPTVPWITEAMVRSGADVSTLCVFEKAV